MIPARFVPIAVSAGLTLTACVSAPAPPARPDFTVAADSYSEGREQIVPVAVVSAEWWTQFDDPVLTQLIELALAENKDLAVAAANIETARARLNRQTLNESFSTSANASGDVGRAAREGADVEVSGNASLGASWEFDAYGGIAAQIEGAARQVEAFEEVRRDVAVTVAAETALAYVDYRGNQVRLDVARSNASLQSDSVDLLNALFENGRATRLDVERAEAQYRTTLASLPLLEINIRTAAIRLAVLTGRTEFDAAAWLDQTASGTAIIPVPPASLNIGAPQDLIRRRPDIRAAEADIARLLALGDVERARLFPTLTFNADLLALLPKTIQAPRVSGLASAQLCDGKGLICDACVQILRLQMPKRGRRLSIMSVLWLRRSERSRPHWYLTLKSNCVSRILWRPRHQLNARSSLRNFGLRKALTISST